VSLRLSQVVDVRRSAIMTGRVFMKAVHHIARSKATSDYVDETSIECSLVSLIFLFCSLDYSRSL